jgi:membrane-bound lytic murein transglycosylase B
MRSHYLIPAVCLSLATYFACAATEEEIPKFIDEMVLKHQFDRAELGRVFDQTRVVSSVIDTMSQPATLKPWPEYRAAFVNPERINLGLKFWKKYRMTLREAEREFGVPQEIIVALLGVESIYGRNAGKFRTIDALTTLAFDYPRRADFFRSELESYLLLAREQHLDPLSVRGSYAGALGIPQFMPSSYRSYGVDFNGNHKIDLIHEPKDAIGSVARYLKAYGWVNATSASTSTSTSDQAAHGAMLPIAIPVRVSPEACLGDITTPRTVAEWAALGIKATRDNHLEYHQDQTARLVDLTDHDAKEFWLVFKNFDVITQYNNSDFYAMSVFQLAQALREARKLNHAM